MRMLLLFCAILLFVACLNLPIQYYTLLRIVVTLGALSVLFKEFQKDVNLLGITFVGITVVFNPIIPVYLHEKSHWIPIDFISGLLFLYYSFKNSNSKLGV